MLHLIIGPMFSGKTSELIRHSKREHIAGKRCVVISGDQRHDCPKNHDKNEFENATTILVDPKLGLSEVALGVIDSYDSFFIDEAQFFPDADIICDKLAELGKNVYVAGISGNHHREPMGRIPWLVAKADRISHLTAVCVLTGLDAPFSQRLVGDQDAEVVIGGAEKYRSVSRKCFVNHM